MPPHRDVEGGLARLQRVERHVELALADIAPRANDVGHHVDGQDARRCVGGEAADQGFELGMEMSGVARPLYYGGSARGARHDGGNGFNYHPVPQVRSSMSQRFSERRPGNPIDSLANHDQAATLGYLLRGRRQLRRCGRGVAPLRQLVAEHRRDVRLFVDALPVLSRIAPDVDPTPERQSVQGVASCAGRARPSDAADGAAHVVIEAFGCGLPPSYLDAMARCRRRRCGSISNTCRPSAGSTAAMAWSRATRGCPCSVISSSRDSPRRAAACCAKPACFARRDAFQADAGARARILALARRSARRSRRARGLAVLLSEPPSAAAARCLGGWRRAGVLHRARGRRRGRTRSVDRRRGAPPGTDARARAPLAGGISVRRARRLRPAALGLRLEPGARRGLVRARAVGGATAAWQPYPQAEDAQLVEARRISSNATCTACRRRCASIFLHGSAHGTTRRRRRIRRPGWDRFAAALPRLARARAPVGGRISRPSPISPATWSRWSSNLV